MNAFEHGVAVSVVVPARNEAINIERCLDAILANAYPAIEVLVVDGQSDDGTTAIVGRYAAADDRVRLLENPQRTVPAALNIGWQQARGEIIVRVDAHAFVAGDYIERTVANLRSGEFSGTGGRKNPISPTAVGQVIAVAMSSRWGVGGSRYHYASAPEEADHVPFGAYPRAVISDLGGWDERFTVNQDFEFDFRLRQSGGRILFDPAVECDWLCSATIGDLAHQYRRYGRGKFNVGMRHPSSVSPRHILPPVGVVGLTALVIRACLPGGRLARWLLGSYVAVMASSSWIGAARRLPVRLRAMFPLVVVTMHVSQGVGFLLGFFDFVRGRRGVDPHQGRSSINR